MTLSDRVGAGPPFIWKRKHWALPIHMWNQNCQGYFTSACSPGVWQLQWNKWALFHRLQRRKKGHLWEVHLPAFKTRFRRKGLDICKGSVRIAFQFCNGRTVKQIQCSGSIDRSSIVLASGYWPSELRAIGGLLDKSCCFTSEVDLQLSWFLSIQKKVYISI